MDVVARVPRHPESGETVLGTALTFVPGGKGANQAVAACRLGASTDLVGRVGTDTFADQLLEFLAQERVGTSGLRRHPGLPTGTAIVVVDGAGDNTIVVIPGANHAVGQEDVDTAAINEGDVVLVQFEVPVDIVVATLERAQRLGARTILNPAPAQSASADVLELPDVVVVNETELAFFSRSDDVLEGLRVMQRRPDQVVIATLGADGVAALIGDEVVRVPGHEVPVLDTTGAGDCFVGALAAAMCSWAETDEAIHFANLAASLAVQRLGAGTGMPHLSDVERVT
jgi:ribokinase